MTKKSIIQNLSDYFNKDFRKKLKREKTLKGLLQRLEKKEIKLKKKFVSEKDAAERLLIEKKIKILAAHRKKAYKKLR